jgi:hypothetical protein
MWGTPARPSRARAETVFAICIRENGPSCIRAPPEAEIVRRGSPERRLRSTARTSFSPKTEPMLAPRKSKSLTASTTG